MMEVQRPDNLEQFCELASLLYQQPECDLGGPLHVELEDHNTELLVGNNAVRQIKRFDFALEMIEGGNIPPQPASPPKFGEGWSEAALIHNEAHYYGMRPDALRIARSILEITQNWTEEQAAGAYAVWADEYQGGACGCSKYPSF